MSTNTPTLPETKTPANEGKALPTDSRPHTWLGWWLVIGGLGGFMAWACLAPLDQGVPMTGTVAVAGNKKAVQHLTGGTIDQILVREGDEVKAGQVLVRMNAVQARANAEITRIQYMNALATEARLIAERDSLPAINFPSETLDSTDPQVVATLNVQRQIFSTRHDVLRSEIGAIEQNIAGLQSQGVGIQTSREGKQQQLQLLREQIEGARDLATDGYMPRNRLLELERTRAQIEASIAEDLGALGQSLSQVGELKLRALQARQDFQREVRAQLADIQKETAALHSRLESFDHELNNVEVKAPANGIVSDLSIFTEGGVIAPGVRMMDIVPMDGTLIIEGQVPVHLIDSVHPQLPVELIFSAFNQNTTPRIPGIVTQVSPDRLIDEKTGLPYYRLYADILPEGKKILLNLKLRPGMPVDMFVRTGERTLANYLIRPMRDHLRMALTEE